MQNNPLKFESAFDKEYAFFDVDDTLIADKSMLSFQTFWLEKYGDEIARARYEKDVLGHISEEACWNDLNRRYYAQFAGRKVKQVEQCALEWFSFIQSKVKPFFYQNSVAELKWHQANHRDVVFVSGSFHALLRPIAKCLAVQHILAIQMEEEGGYYTGNIIPPQTIGEGKAQAVEAFLAERSADKSQCYAYGDDISDLPMLSVVGYPCVIQGGRGLEVYAQEHGWRTMAPA